MFPSFKKNWLVYLTEFAGLAGFVIGAGLLTIFLEHPCMPVMKSFLKDHALLRRVPLGLVMGIYIVVITKVLGKRSGAHFNPCVTWTFYRLGKINMHDVLFYTIAQFAGAVFGAQLLKLLLRDLFSHASVNYGVTAPKPPYETMTVFVAEFIISFILMLVILITSSSRRFEKYVPLIAGLLIAVYLIIEIPFSGMSLNPARSFAGALAGNQWARLWVYFVAPMLAMLAASEVFIIWKQKQLGLRYYDFHLIKTGVVNDNYKEIPNYPIKEVLR